MPVLIFTDVVEDRGASSYRALYVKNIGYGPALNIVRNIMNVPLPLNSLRPGDQIPALHATEPGEYAVPILDNLNFKAFVECDDVLGQSYEFIYRKRILFGPKHVAIRNMPAARAHRI